MPANTVPIYPVTPKADGVVITSSTTANVRTDGNGTIGTDIVLVSSAGSNGTFYRFVRVKPWATASATSTSATVIRVFKSTQSSGATSNANTHLLGEIQIPAVSAANTTGALPDFDIPLNIALPTGQHLLACTAIVAAANTGFAITAVGGDY